MLLRRHYRVGVADEPFFLEPAGHLLLHIELGHMNAIADASSHALERTIFDSVKCSRRLPMGRQRVIIPHRFEPLHQIARRVHFDSTLSNQLNRAGINSRDIWDGALRRIFHRNTLHSGQQSCEFCIELFPSRIRRLAAGQGIEGLPLDRMNQPFRLAGCWH